MKFKENLTKKTYKDGINVSSLKLKSIDGAPAKFGSFNCYDNIIASFDGAPKEFSKVNI